MINFLKNAFISSSRTALAATTNHVLSYLETREHVPLLIINLLSTNYPINYVEIMLN